MWPLYLHINQNSDYDMMIYEMDLFKFLGQEWWGIKSEYKVHTLFLLYYIRLSSCINCIVNDELNRIEFNIPSQSIP